MTMAVRIDNRRQEKKKKRVRPCSHRPLLYEYPTSAMDGPRGELTRERMEQGRPWRRRAFEKAIFLSRATGTNKNGAFRGFRAGAERDRLSSPLPREKLPSLLPHLLHGRPSASSLNAPRSMAIRLVLCFFLLVVSAAADFQQPNTDGFYLAAFFDAVGGGRAVTAAATDVCSWEGVTCGDGGRVTGVAAAGAGLAGDIPDSTIGKLHGLTSLDLSGNGISALPSDFWELGGSLERLDLSGNRIGGALANNIGNFGRLRRLDLSGNRFSGELPTAIGAIAALEALNLSGNQFTGGFPSDIVAGCKNLVSLDLSSNAVDGPLPELSSAAKLRHLDLSGNRMSGTLAGVFLLSSLEFVDVSNNAFDGALPPINGSSSLAYIDLSANALGGRLFADFSKFAGVKHVNLASNRFAMESFPLFGESSALEYLNLSKTGLAGAIPPELSRLPALKTLDLSGNFITGQVPELSRAGGLAVLDLSSNNLTGEVPLPLQRRLPALQRFNFSYNNLTFCATSELSLREYAAAFIGSRSSCPLAVDPNSAGGAVGRRHKQLMLASAVVAAVFVLLILLLCIAFVYRRTRMKRAAASPAVKPPAAAYREDSPPAAALSGPFAFQTDTTTWFADVKSATSVPVIIFEKPLLGVTFADLLAATANFDRGTLLAEGRFGPVYRGFLAGGIQVAVKVLVQGIAMADGAAAAAREFERLGRIRHPNLVPLLGYCFAGEQSIALYDYMENGSLHNLLHDLPLGVQHAADDWSGDNWDADGVVSDGATTWRFRHRIALGVARALAFLHHGCIPQIVHRDVKASSVYFDADMEPRLSMIAGAGELSLRTPGYIPPEFDTSAAAAATVQSDVYGFGVVLFEMITGKRPVGDEYPGGEKDATLVSWARAMVKRSCGAGAIDAKIRDTGPEKQMEEALRIAYLCTADLPAKRPAMQQIVGLLKDIEPTKPTAEH